MCVDASSSRLFKGSAPQNGGYRVQWAKREGASHEREQSTKVHLRKSVPMRDQPLVRWSPMPEGRQGKRRQSRFVREARAGGQARRADRVLGRDFVPHRAVVEGSKTAGEGGCRRAP